MLFLMNADHLEKIGRNGGLMRIKRHGNPGTQEGRRLGGLHSIKTHAKNKSGFKTLKSTIIPRHSARLAELIGILMGDGHIGLYQASVVTNSDTDFHHALFIKTLIEGLFKIQVPIYTRRDKKACVVTISSKSVCHFFTTQGIPKGNKITNGMNVPRWIKEKASYRKAFVRGLFDTDGCVYIDTHHSGLKTYRNLGMAFANQSLPLLSFFKESLEQFGLHPTQKTKFRVFLRRKEDIQQYFDLIGSSNEKHSKKFHEYFLINKVRRGRIEV